MSALTVLFSHSFPLSQGPSTILYLVRDIGMTYGSTAVDVLFIISGFFITRGFITRKSLWGFVRSRILRIYPGIIFATLFCVFVVGLYFSNVGVAEYFDNEQTWKFVKRNMLLYSNVKYFLPGVFDNNPYSPAVVGAIWTLPYQLRAYASLILIGLFFQWILGDIEKGSAKIVYLLAVFIIVFLNVVNVAIDFAQVDFLRLMAMFYIGSSYYILRNIIVLSVGTAFSLLLLLGLSLLIEERLFYAIYAFSLPYFVMCLAYLPKGRIRRFNHFGDYSYGIYIYGTTMQQSIVAVVGELSVGLMFIYSCMVTLCMAYLSWHLVEKQFLKLRY